MQLPQDTEKSIFGAVTIVSANYLPLAQTLAESFYRYHPGSLFWICLCDYASYETIDKIYESGAIPIPFDCLGIPDSERTKYRYSILELNTAIKPYALKYCFNKCKSLRAVAYLDPDIKVYSYLADVWDPLLAGECDQCLTPHLLTPINDQYNPTILNIIQAGTYNLGFIGLARSNYVYSFLEWWSEMLFLDCEVDIPRGLFTDQKWIDLVPGFNPKCKIIYNPAYNVSYWNLHERTIETRDDCFFVNGQPLAFYHFSGFSPLVPHVLSKHQDRHTFENREDVKMLFSEYAADLLAHDYDQQSKSRYAFDNLTETVENSPVFRSIMMQCMRDQVSYPCPSSNLRQFSEFILVPRFRGKRIISLFLEQLLKMRQDVAEYYELNTYLTASNLLQLDHWLYSPASRELKLLSWLSYIEAQGLRPLISTNPADWSKTFPVTIKRIEFVFDINLTLKKNLDLFFESSPASLDDLSSRVLDRDLNWCTESIIRFCDIVCSRIDLLDHFNMFSNVSDVKHLLDWAYQDETAHKSGIAYEDWSLFRLVLESNPRFLLECLQYKIPTLSLPKSFPSLKSLRLWRKRELSLNLAGYFDSPTGVGEAARCIERCSTENPRLHVAKVTIPSPYNSYRHDDHPSETGRSSHFVEPNCSMTILNADSTGLIRKMLPQTFFSRHYGHIGLWHWETPKLPERYTTDMQLFSRIFVTSHYAKLAVSQSTNVPVDILPLCTDPLEIETYTTRVTPSFRGALDKYCANRFTIGFAYDAKSFSIRKNPEAVIKVAAMVKEVYPSLGVVIKVSSPNLCGYEFARFLATAERLGAYVILDDLKKSDVYYFLNRIDAFVSLHRAEGFGLMLLEAMSLGTLAVATDYSGNKDFMTSENSIPVPYKPMSLDKDFGPYDKGTVWADPDVSYCCDAIIECINNPGLKARLENLALQQINQNYSPLSVGSKLEQLLLYPQS